jgi:glycosyltransferase involved in cell wall biosynthesis
MTELAARAGRYARAGSRWARLLAGGRPRPGIRVFYGHDRVPSAGEPVAGGTAKFQRLATRFPNHPIDFSILYLGSTWLPRDLGPLLWDARRRRIPLLVNQNGVGYPGWAGEGAEAFNRPLRRIIAPAEHVLYQSEFCKRSADRFLAAAPSSWEVLPNAVDVERFTPSAEPPPGGPVLLLGGDQTQAYRLELALRTLAEVLRTHPGAELVVTGRVTAPLEPLAAELGVAGRVRATGRYAQRDAPALYRAAHLLLHTKVNDPCPNVVLEALASGLPVVYPASGGTVELVGPDAGFGVPHPDGFERDEPPAPAELAAAVVAALGSRERLGEAARRRAVERFPLDAWLDRHTALFEELVARARRPAR